MVEYSTLANRFDMADQVYINLLSAQEIQAAVEGIGAARAQLIVSKRSELGTLNFASLRQLDVPMSIWDPLLDSGRLSFSVVRTTLQADRGSDSPQLLKLMESLAEKFDTLSLRLDSVESSQVKPDPDKARRDEIRKLQREQEVEHKEQLENHERKMRELCDRLGGSPVAARGLGLLSHVTADSSQLSPGTTAIIDAMGRTAPNSIYSRSEASSAVGPAQRSRAFLDEWVDDEVNKIYSAGPLEDRSSRPDANGRNRGKGSVQSTSQPRGGGGSREVGPREMKKLPGQQGFNLIPKLSTFSGREDWRPFDMQFEHMASRCGWTAMDKLDMLVPLLREKALTFYSNLPLAVRGHYSQLKGKLNARFGNKDPQVMVIHQLNLMKQSSEDSLDDFIQQTYRLAIDGLDEASDSTVEKLTIEAFLNGVRNQEAAMHVRNREPKTMDEALRLMKVHAQNMGGDKAVKSCRQVTFEDQQDELRARLAMGPPVPTRQGAPVSESLSAETLLTVLRQDRVDARKEWMDMLRQVVKETSVKSSLAGVGTIPGQSGNRGDGRDSGISLRPQTPAREVNSCMACGGKGHFMSECPSKTSSSGQQTPPRETNACFACGGKGHFRNECPSRGLSRSPRGSPRVLAQTGMGGMSPGGVTCFRCQGRGHFMADCPSKLFGSTRSSPSFQDPKKE